MAEAKVILEKFDEDKLKEVWAMAFTDNQPEWTKWNGPYFNDYTPYPTFEDFKASSDYDFLLSDNCRSIIVDGAVLGMVSRYWKSKDTRWLEVGIILYPSDQWSKGIGTRAMHQWISICFDAFPVIKHISLTTWSGNVRMMKSAEKLGMAQEGKIRKVRYWQDVYYDSVIYGILRSEWDILNNLTIKEYTDIEMEEILPLYEDVGWTNYTNKPDMLEEAYRYSLKVLAAYSKDKLVGILRAVGDGHSIVFIQDIIVLSDYQRLGIGSKLVEELLKAYPDVYQVHLFTDNSEQTVRFYHSLGFKSEAEVGLRAFTKL